ncbi:Sulfonamide resistance protein [Serratia liquefaciens]|jgi:DHA1 family bicyclomycin/chloramphenicol resistance-like MFS transporter|uniref:Bcr/CflA family efflux transporter n=2 Tax=Pseudomonadota TaxID=1224 RepID=A0ABX7D0C2_SERLI|nr:MULTISPECIES: multidrug effflux MFS transporter [Serratia]AGQ29882.1 MFS transporter [Serratia liquefaciens ATCC 27592]AYO36653.1 Bcr/CflA family efflux MFS transporter [Serratia sp. P2ACOL2]MBI6160936.1 multidrug effflux MFS transporter [Serratia liquefaciens]MBV0840643.1 multidrug effflux MFS transporter [Serratia liquefaciens]MCS4315859.1 DHA1 family bicyclomycin/chloramphenicol resistance-like MFS transporter [Serratia sp. BIGb0234]
MTRPLARQRLVYALVLGLLASLGPLCIDLYLPALPEMAGELNTSTATAQLSLTAGLLGLGVGQLIFGPYSDKLGRMRPLLVSLALLLFASLWCALAPNIDQLLIARLLQGLAGAGGAVISRAIARDLYSGHELTRFFALLMLVNGLAPIVAPVLGGAMLQFMDWRGIFGVLAGIAVLLFTLASLKLSESLPAERRSQGGILAMLQSLGGLLTQRQFMGLCLTQGFVMAGMFAYIGASPFVLQQIYGLSPQMFSLCFAINGVGLIISAQISSRLSIHWGERKVLKGGLTLAAVSSLLLLLAASLHAPLVLLLVPLFFSVAVIGIVGPTASSLAMQSQGDKAGSASALIGVSMFALGACSVPLTGLGGTSSVSMALTIVGCYAIAILLFKLLVRKPQA